MLELARGLSPSVRAALAALETRTLAVDGGRLKLEWGTLERRSGRVVEDVLWWDGDRLLGFLGLYSFGASTVEMAGMVDPAARRRGIGRALLDAALGVCATGRRPTALLVVPRSSVGGRALALGRGGTPDHSEHALLLTEPPVDGPTDPRVTVRTATGADAPVISRLVTTAFGGPAPLPDVDRGRSLVVGFDGATVGTVRVTLDHGTGGVYGFVVDPAWRGRGIGRDVLRRVCRQLLADGAARVGLEVAVDNDHALGLYTSVGFVRVGTEDYYAIPG